jgi:hypothetical protein
MDARHRGIQILGWLSIIAGYGFALLLIRGIFLGITRGFSAVPSQAFAILLAYLIFFALAIYLFSVGRRALSIANGSPRPKARFGWRRIILGAILLFSSANSHFHLFPTRTVIKPLEPSNPTQAAAMNATAIVIAIGCIILIFSGIWVGVRRPVVKS